MKNEINEYKKIIDEYKNPKIIPNKLNIKINIFLILLCYAIYIIEYFFMPPKITQFFLKKLNLSVTAYFVILDLIMLFIVILCFFKELKGSYNNFKTQIKKYLQYLLYSLVTFSILNFIITIICNLLVKDIPSNQTAIESLNIGYILFSTLIYAPLVEEILFRGMLKKLIKNNYIFILTSGLIFGLLHVIGSSSLIQYLYIFVYGLCGMYLATLYSKYNNIYLNMVAHFILNFAGVIHILINFIK